MNKSIEVDLLSLLPEIGTIPPELQNLAASFIAQSRSKASLKPDEEIARGYACANLACERLKQKLDLPRITPHPPCPPRIYKKVFAYLSSSLTIQPVRQNLDGPSAPSTPSKRRIESRSAANTPQKPQTPRALPDKQKENGGMVGMPEWVMPAIRAVCKTLRFPNAAPHVFSGVASVVAYLREQKAEAGPQGPRKRGRPSKAETAALLASSFDEKHMPALIAVIAFYTKSELYEAPTPDQYTEQRRLTVETLAPFDPAENTELQMIIDIEKFMRQAQSGWLDMDWYRNLRNVDREDAVNAGSEGGPMDVDEDDRDLRRKRKQVADGDTEDIANQRSGTMMVGATRWLSERQKEDYREWKSRILAEMERVEATVRAV